MPRKRPAPRPAPGIDYGFTPSEREAEPKMVRADPTDPVLYETETKDPIVPDRSALRNVQPSGAGASRPAPTPIRPQAVTYQSRIRVIDAWQYAGSLRDAPDFVDRNWAGWDDTPILRVPHYAHPDGEPIICRVLDYVVRQEVKLAEGMPSMERVEVWPKEDFERLFIPHRISGADPADNHGPKAPAPDLQREPRQSLEVFFDDNPPAGQNAPDEPQAA